MTGTDLAIIFATLTGPILAVQAQKWVEVAREKRRRKLQIFETLMATRAARMSLDHVQALNMIELAFYGRIGFIGVRRQSGKEKAVVNAWHTLLASFGFHGGPPTDQGLVNQNFKVLLMAIASDVGYELDQMQITESAYSPAGHMRDQLEQETLRRCLVEVLSGEKSLKMDVVNFPNDEALAASTVDLQRKVAGAFADGALVVTRKEPA